MTKYNSANERIKRRYLIYQREAMRKSESSIDTIAAAINRFDTFNRYRDFKSFHIQWAIDFKTHLAGQINSRTGKPLSKATQNGILNAVKGFFVWLADQQGYRSRLSYADAEYFNISLRDAQLARTHDARPVPTLHQIEHILRQMPDTTIIERRDRAVIALVTLTGIRGGAAVSLKRKHVDIDNKQAFQDGREVRTKFGKTIMTDFFPVGDYVLQIVVDWVRTLDEELLFGPEDPFFPKTRIEQSSEYRFQAVGIIREHWSTSQPIRNIFKKACQRAGLAYFNPHSCRNMLSTLAERRCITAEEFKAWSQNVGHEKPITSFLSYGHVPPERQSAIIRGMGSPKEAVEKADLFAAKVAEVLRKERIIGK